MSMSYLTAAYTVFVLVLGWDFLAPRVKLSRVRRAIQLRQQREAARAAGGGA